MSSFKMILPVDSTVEINKNELPITTLVISKKNDIKKINISFINHREKVYEENFLNVDINLQSSKDKVIFNINAGKKKLSISGRKILSDELLKNYFEPLKI